MPEPTALVHIGAGATVESEVDMHGWWIDGQEIVVGEVTIGAGARVGTRTLLMPGARVGDGAEIEPGSVVTGAIPAGERWAGAVARHEGPAGESWPAEPPAPCQHPRRLRALFSAGLAIHGLVPLLAIVPGLLALHLAGAPEPTIQSSPAVLVLEAFVITATFLLSYALIVAGIVRAAWRLIRPGWQTESGVVGWALWFSEDLLASARVILFPIYNSLYTRPWLRLIGLRVGYRTEISTALGLSRLVSFGRRSFVADDVVLSPIRARHGWLHLEPITVGDGSFLGNGSVLRGDTQRRRRHDRGPPHGPAARERGRHLLARRTGARAAPRRSRDRPGAHDQPAAQARAGARDDGPDQDPAAVDALDADRLGRVPRARRDRRSARRRRGDRARAARCSSLPAWSRRCSRCSRSGR